MSPFVLLHLSDLHVSAFGDCHADRAHVVKRSARPLHLGEARRKGAGGGTAPRYDLVWEEAGWQVHRDQAARGERLVLLDPQGYGHPVPGPKQLRGVSEALARAVLRAGQLQARRSDVLAERPPGPSQLQAMLRETPTNTNLRLLRAAGEVQAMAPDLVLITGDLTDDGFGYELIEAAFRPLIERGRLLAIPGNHDLYLFPIASSGRPQHTAASKRAAWQAFAGRLGLALDESGAWVWGLPEAGLIVAGLNSCPARQPRFYRQNGAIGAAQLDFLRRLAQGPAWQEARHRIVAFHHHLVPLAHGVGRRTPTEIGMRLDDAREVAAVLGEVGATFVLHGHRHVSEERHPAGCHFRLLAAPSLTLGCKSGAGPSLWRVELDHRAHVTRVAISADAVPQEE